MKIADMIDRMAKVCSILILILSISCVKDRNFDAPETTCTNDLVANISFSGVKELFKDKTIHIQGDFVLEGYVTSSDREGNFFNVLHFQDRTENPTQGLQIEIDLRDSHLFYPPGSKIFIKLNGLYLAKSGDVYKLGGTFTAFGNVSVGRLPATVLDQHIVVSCDGPNTITPRAVTLDSLESSMAHTLVRLKDVEFLEDELGLPFAVREEETERTLVDCKDRSLILLNSGFSNFQENLLPEGSGEVQGVLLKDGSDFQLVIRSLNDIDFSLARCGDFVDEFTSKTIFISELADPNNNTGARFVELYNAGTESLSLKGWKLQRYTNDNVEVGSSIDLSENTIEAGSTLVISPNAQEFETVYGFLPDLGVGTNSPADSNGDDNLELVDPFGTVIDIFGVVGEDGSGTNHEFEDGKALRNLSVTGGNPVYTFEEWTIFNDTGDSGTINQPQNAPGDFNPGNRN